MPQQLPEQCVAAALCVWGQATSFLSRVEFDFAILAARGFGCSQLLCPPTSISRLELRGLLNRFRMLRLFFCVASGAVAVLARSDPIVN
jgi:hypothetical protein